MTGLGKHTAAAQSCHLSGLGRVRRLQPPALTFYRLGRRFNAKSTFWSFELEAKKSPSSVGGTSKLLNLLVNCDDPLDMLILSEAALIKSQRMLQDGLLTFRMPYPERKRAA